MNIHERAAVTSLPDQVQRLLQSKSYRKKDVSLQRTNGPITELPALRQFHPEADDFDDGARIIAVSLVDGQSWLQHSGAQQLPSGLAPFALVELRKYGASVSLDAEGQTHLKQGTPATMQPQTAQLLTIFVQVRAGEYRTAAIREFTQHYGDGMYKMALDELVGLGLIKPNAAGSLLVTPKGRELGSRVPRAYDYDRLRWEDKLPEGQVTLSGTTQEHTNDFIQAKHEVLEAINDASEALTLGHCLTAGNTIDSGYMAIGRMQAHAYEGEEIGEAARLLRELRDVDRPFEERCVRTEPVSETREKMTWLNHGLAGSYDTHHYANELQGYLANHGDHWTFTGHAFGGRFTYELNHALGPASRPIEGPAMGYAPNGSTGHVVVKQRGVVVGTFSVQQRSITRPKVARRSSKR